MLPIIQTLCGVCKNDKSTEVESSRAAVTAKAEADAEAEVEARTSTPVAVGIRWSCGAVVVGWQFEQLKWNQVMSRKVHSRYDSREELSEFQIPRHVKNVRTTGAPGV